MRKASASTTLLFAICLGCVAHAAEQEQAAAVAALVTSYHDIDAFNGSALVARNGKVLWKKGLGMADFEWSVPNTPDTKFRLGSITKQFTATLVLQLIEEGKLSLDTKLADALPYYRQDTGSRVTIHQLLNHTSGIPSYTDLESFASEVSRDPYGVREFVERFCSGDLQFEPGSAFRYDNSGYFLLGAIVEQVTGATYEALLQQRIFGPLGMQASGYDRNGPILAKRARGYDQRLDGVRNTGYLDMSLPYAAGSLYSTVEDLFRWDQALYGDTILPARAKERMFTPGLEHYGYGWDIRRVPLGPGGAERTTIRHEGGINGFHTLIARVPEDRHLVVLLNNTGGTSLEAISAGILDILYGRTPAAPRPSVARELYDVLRQGDVAAAVARYREWKQARAEELDFGEAQLNRLGYELLEAQRPAEAIEFFRLNVEAFPESANAYDSLAEGYMAAGERTLSIKNYAKSLELDPQNRHAVAQLNELLHEGVGVEAP